MPKGWVSRLTYLTNLNIPPYPINSDKHYHTITDRTPNITIIINIKGDPHVVRIATAARPIK